MSLLGRLEEIGPSAVFAAGRRSLAAEQEIGTYALYYCYLAGILEKKR